MEKFTIGDEVMVMRRKCNTDIGKKLVRKTGFVQMIIMSSSDSLKRRLPSEEEFKRNGPIACIEFPGKFRIVPLLQSELKIINYKYMNTNTPRPTTVKQDITKFLSENADVVNPLVIAKAVRRKLSSVRRELNKMIADGLIVATYDKKGFYTSIKLKTFEFNSTTSRTWEGVSFNGTAKTVAYEADPLKDAVEQNEKVGNDFYQTQSELELKAQVPTEKLSFWGKVLRLFA